MHNQNLNQAYQSILDKLSAVRRTWRWLILSEGFLKWISILAGVMTAILLCFQFIHSTLLRNGMIIIAAGVTLYITFRFLIRPLLRKLTFPTVASYLEKSHPNIENRILSTVQLKPTLEDNRLGYATEFVEQLILQTQDDVNKIESKKTFQTEFGRIKRNAGFAVITLCIMMGTNFLLPSALKGFTKTIETLPKTPLDVITAQITDVTPGNLQIKRGEDVTITAMVSGHLDAPVHLYYQLANTEDESLDKNTTQDLTSEDINENEDGNQLPHLSEHTSWQSILMTRQPTELPYSITIENIDRSIQYYVSTKEISSHQYDILVSHEPIVKTFQLQLNYPEYTQLPSKVLEENIGDVDVIYGTEIVFSGESNKSLKEAHLIFEESDLVELQVDDGTLMKGSFIAQQAGTYHIQIQDINGLTNSDPLTHTLNVFNDEPPQVGIVEPGIDLVLDNDMLVKLKVEATDDYGLHALQLVYRIQKENADDIPITLKQIPSTTKPQTSIFLSYSWDVDPVGLFPGEVISYYVQALDIDNVSGPNIGKSRTYTLRFPTLGELYEELAAEQEVEQIGLDELYDEQSDATGMVDQLLDKIRKSNELSLTDKKLIQQVVEAQQEIEQKANELISQMEQTTSDMDKQQLFEPETIQKYQELQELMKEALTEEHQEILKKLSEALAKQQLSEQEDSMAEANFNQEQFQLQLERMKSLYQQLILQQKLEAAAKQAENLAEQQKQLMDSLDPAVTENTTDPSNAKESDSTNTTQTLDTTQTETQQKEGTLDQTELSDAAQKEDRIKQDSEKLSEKLDTIGNEMSDLANARENAPPQMQRIADEVKRLNQFTKEHQLSDMLQKTSDSLLKQQQQNALQTGRDAEETMTALAHGLENALEFMEGANANQVLTAMREAVKGSLYFSHIHEKVINQTNELTITNLDDYIPSEIRQLQQLAAEELSTGEGIADIGVKLWELGKQQMQIDPKIVWRLNASSDALNRAARALEDRQASLALPIQKEGLAEINQAIFELLNAIAQMNQQMGTGGLQDMLEQLQQLAQSQQQLNEMAQNLSQQMRERGQTPSLQQRLDRIASQQQLIREATERLAEMAENAAEMLGSLKDVAEEMKEVEQKLEQGTLNDQVIDQQERILTRMLDSLKSLQKRDSGRQRKAQVAKKPTAPPKEAPPLHPELLKIVRKLETTPNAQELENIPFQYREQLRQYFKALSQKTVNE